MKYFLLLCVFVILCLNIADAQTNAGIPDASTVLVVYNVNSTLSDSIMQYYVEARGIPSPSNVVPLQLPRREISVGDWSDPHIVKLGYSDEYIQDSTWAVWDSTHCVDTAKFHAWQYFLEEVWDPIRLHLQQNNLTSSIRYIVMCRGVPYKIQAAGDWSVPGNISLDGLLCMMNTENYDSFVETIFNVSKALCYFESCDPNAPPCYGNAFISNPYFDKDPNFEMNARFLTDYYTGYWGGYNYKLSYLVSRLDGLSFDIVKNIIDKSVAADQSGEKTWILDGSGTGGEISQAFIKLNTLGFTTEYNDDIDNWITTSLDSVIGYTSDGVHQGMPPTYIQDTLDFNYANGAVFNTYESFNGYSIGTLRRAGQGLMTEFLLTGGTGGAGHGVWEPYGGAVKSSIYFPYYAIGYNQIDAAWQSMPGLAWRSVFVGDPLTRIYNCENTVISSNTTIGSGDYECNVIVPQNVVLTIESGATINFGRNAVLKVYGTLVVSSNDTLRFKGYSQLKLEESAELILQQNMTFEFWDYSSFFIDNDVVLDATSQFYFNGFSKLIINGSAEIPYAFNLNLLGRSNCEVNGSLTLASNALLNVNGFNSSTLKNYGTMLLNDGSEFNINGLTSFLSYGVFKSLGTVNNYVAINCPASPSDRLYFSDVDTLLLSYTIIDSGSINLSISDGILKPRLISINNSIINDAFRSNQFNVINTEDVNAILSDNQINCVVNSTGIIFSGFNNVQLLRNIIQNTETGLGKGISIINNKTVEIKDCEIINFVDGIVQGRLIEEETITVNNQDISINNCTISGTGYSQGVGISLGYDLNSSPTTANIDFNNISAFSTCIAINNPNNFPVGITNNTLSNYKLFGISLAGGNDAIITGNIITVDEPDAVKPIGISVNLVNNPLILDNTINAEGVTDSGDGIFSVSSSGGQIRNNTIQHHLYGIELGSASPNVGANTITDNLRYGIYINDNSHPDLSEQIIGGDPYPLSGYNTIRKNGECNVLPSYSELYLANRSTVNLEKGCNTIADDRDDPALHCNYLYLIDGNHVVGKVNAFRNYWGEVNGGNPVGRFGPSLNVNYGGWQTVPCTYTEIGNALLLTNSQGEVYDTVYSSGEAPSELTDIESRYASANEYYYNNQYTQAKQEYQGIIEDYGDSTESLQAYNRLYTLSNLMNSSPETFTQLKDYYLQKASNQTDSIMIGTLTHLSDLCLVSATEYITAINNFDEEAQQNPNTDIALYRQIDALTTALLLPQDSTMNKGRLGKYSVNDLSDYTNKLSELIKTRGKSGLESEEELLPTQYTLYQNYPNPFNPTTTIKYDLPSTSEVSLIIYDILGRKVKELVNTKQEAGRYEIQFNASNLASGVYLYQLRAEDFIETKKMLLLK